MVWHSRNSIIPLCPSLDLVHSSGKGHKLVHMLSSLAVVIKVLDLSGDQFCRAGGHIATSGKRGARDVVGLSLSSCESVAWTLLCIVLEFLVVPFPAIACHVTACLPIH